MEFLKSVGIARCVCLNKKYLLLDVRFFLKFNPFFLLKFRMFVHICLHLDDVIILWEPIERCEFVVQSFIGF